MQRAGEHDATGWFMRRFHGLVPHICAALLATLAFFALARPASAAVLEQVDVREKDKGFQLRIGLSIPMGFQRVSPQGPAREFIIELLARPTGQGIDEAAQHSQDHLGFDKNSSAPVQEVLYDGLNTGRPTITLRLTRAATISVRNDADLKTLIVDLTPVGMVAPLAATTAFDDSVSQIDLTLQPVMKDAKQALLDGKLDRAIQLFTKIVESGDGPLRRQALELLGLTRERNHQLAQAAAEYNRYLKDYPEGPDSDRVRQRLSALVTIDKRQKPSATRAASQSKPEKKWRTEADGSLAQYYYRNTVNPPGAPAQTTQSALSTDVDVRVRARSDNYDLRALFVGSYDADFLTGGEDVKRLYNATIELRDFKRGLYGKLGRQTSNTGGVFGRFDGVQLSADALDHLAVKGFFGYPVESSRDVSINSARKLFGAGLDFKNVIGSWSFGTYFVEQTNTGLTDRRAVGAEVKYFAPGRSLYGLVDYDIFFKELSTAFVMGTWSFSQNTTVNASLDYRKGPFLTTENAIVGQGVTSLSDLLGVFTPTEIYQLALDRTATSKSVTLGLTQVLTDRLSLYSDLTASSLSGTVGSGGVPGYTGTGTNIFWTTQLVASDLFRQGAIFIGGLRYSKLDRYSSYGVILNYRFPITSKFRINPRMLIDYRAGQAGASDRVLIRPWLRMDYRFSRWLQFEFEGGVEWYDEMFVNLPSNQTTGTFFYTGYRLMF